MVHETSAWGNLISLPFECVGLCYAVQASIHIPLLPELFGFLLEVLHSLVNFPNLFLHL